MVEKIYVVKMVTGQVGYQEVGYFDTQQGACLHVEEHLLAMDFEACRTEQRSDRDGSICISYHVINKPYLLEFNIFEKDLNKLES